MKPMLFRCYEVRPDRFLGVFESSDRESMECSLRREMPLAEVSAIALTDDECEIINAGDADLATIEAELAALFRAPDPHPPELTLEQEMSALLAAAGPERAPTIEQARAWLWCADTARGRRDDALKRCDWPLAVAYDDLVHALEAER